MMSRKPVRLGVNVDHVATLRNARGASWPDPLRAALLAQEAGADGITVHLREDRRHIRDCDVYSLMKNIALPLNLECAATDEMLDIALKLRPHAVCIVPEKRQEITTEGGLDVISKTAWLKRFITPLRDAGSRVSLFTSHDPAQIDASVEVGAEVVELHTGHYSGLQGMEEVEAELKALRRGAQLAFERGLEVHAGHGLAFDNVAPIAAIPQVVELNIGHFLVGEAVFLGLKEAIHEMRRRIDLGWMEGALGPKITGSVE